MNSRPKYKESYSSEHKWFSLASSIDYAQNISVELVEERKVGTFEFGKISTRCCVEGRGTVDYKCVCTAFLQLQSILVHAQSVSLAVSGDVFD